MDQMTKKERVMAAVKGAPVDRIPVSFFGHNHTAERFPESAVKAMLEEQHKYGWDFMKVQMRATYYGEAWGCKYKWMGPDIGPEVQDHVVKSADDFRKIKKLDPREGVLGEHLNIAKNAGQALKGKTPYVQTIFSPLSIADMLAGTRFSQYPRIGPLKHLIEENPDAVHEALSNISQTMAEYAKTAVQDGADGILLTTWRWALQDVLSEDQYRVFGKPYDLAVIDGAIQAGATFNILHICRENVIFDLLADYPVEVISFNSTSSQNPTLREAMARTEKALWGGIDHTQTLMHGPIEAIEKEVQEAIEQTGGKRFILGPGCAISSKVPENHLRAIQKLLS